MHASPDIRWQRRFANYKKALAQLTKFIDKGDLNELEHREISLVIENRDEPDQEREEDVLQLLAVLASCYIPAFSLGCCSMTISTRRLLARPSAESFLATGLPSPRPCDWMWLAG